MHRKYDDRRFKPVRSPKSGDISKRLSPNPREIRLSKLVLERLSKHNPGNICLGSGIDAHYFPFDKTLVVRWFDPENRKLFLGSKTFKLVGGGVVEIKKESVKA